MGKNKWWPFILLANIMNLMFREKKERLHKVFIFLTHLIRENIKIKFLNWDNGYICLYFIHFSLAIFFLLGLLQLVMISINHSWLHWPQDL